MFEVVIPAHPLPTTIQEVTLRAAVITKLRVCKADPEVTSMPYIRHATGALLTEHEDDCVDAIMDSIDYDALTPWGKAPTDYPRPYLSCPIKGGDCTCGALQIGPGVLNADRACPR